jgi:hypothetical protein
MFGAASKPAAGAGVCVGRGLGVSDGRVFFETFGVSLETVGTEPPMGSSSSSNRPMIVPIRIRIRISPRKPMQDIFKIFFTGTTPYLGNLDLN